jgi:sugar phosphate isomerase/epimerase
MFTLSAFADEIGPDPELQVSVLESCGVRHIELRSIHKTNVLDLSDDQVRDFKALLDRRGFKLSAIGSPIGKIKIDEPFEPHLKRFRRAVELCGVFGTPNIRLFSYYLPTTGGTWEQHRAAVLERFEQKLDIAKKAGVRLLHENEHGIYGDTAARVKDLIATLQAKHGTGHVAAICDPANYAFDGQDAWAAWEATRHLTVHFHVKDWVQGEPHARMPGEGNARLPEIVADAVKRGYDGFATMEPHLLAGGQFGGATGPELFPKAVKAFIAILDRAGATHA